MQRSLALLLAGAISSWCFQSADTGSIIAALRAGNYLQAQRKADAELKQFPTDPRLWTLNGLALARLGESARALDSYEHALHISPDYLAALEGAAEIQYKDGSQAAVGLLERIIKTHPDDETSHAMLAVLAFKRGDCAAAAGEFERSEPLVDSQAGALQQYGSCLLKLKRAREAIPIFDRIAKLPGSGEKARYNLAVVESLAGQYAEVIQTLSPLAHESSPDPDVLDLLAEAYEATSDTPRAVATLRRAILANPGDPRYYVHFADICLVHASYQVGIDVLNAGLKRLPDSAPLYIARGILYVQLGRYEQSESDFSRAEQLDPGAEPGAAARSMAAIQQNNLPEAEATVRDRLKRNPDNPFLWYLLGETLARRGAAVGTPEFSEAVKAASKAVQLQPDFALGRDLLGRLYLQDGNVKGAIEQSRLAVRADRTDQTALYHLILALRKAGKQEEVTKLMRQLTLLRGQARKKEISERKYALVEQNVSGRQ